MKSRFRAGNENLRLRTERTGEMSAPGNEAVFDAP
jgi:hypothetical protein